MEMTAISGSPQDMRQRQRQNAQDDDAATEEGVPAEGIYEVMGLTTLKHPRMTTEEWMTRRRTLAAIFA